MDPPPDPCAFSRLHIVMTILSASGLLAQASPPDTIAVLTSSGPLATIQAMTMIILGVAILGVLVSLLLVLLQLRKIGRTLTRVARRLEKESAPVMDRARSVAENVEFITMAVRTDVQKLTSSVSGLNERLREAATRMEDRIQDFNALVELLQKEAEDLALDTAAAVRGVRAGTRSLAGERSSLSSQETRSLDPRPLQSLTGDDEEEG